VIRVEGLTKKFGRFTAVDGVDLEIGAGDSLALWGANGAGKSTVIRCILGLLRFKGRITVGGIDIARDGKAARRIIGYVPQELGFYDDLRVDEAVRFFARLKQAGIRGTDEVLAGVGLAGHGRKRIRELSGGMKQRLALAIALLGDPPVLVLDEVTASLDACGREEFVGMLRDKAGLGAATGGARTILFASHREDEIHALARRVVVMHRGRTVREVAADSFVDTANPAPIVRLHIDGPDRDQASRILRAGGFDPHLNGVGLLVPVAEAGRASLLSLLEESRIAVHRLEPVLASSQRPAGNGGVA
jgi:ABC-type multidrug transport system ATPase subunit